MWRFLFIALLCFNLFSEINKECICLLWKPEPPIYFNDDEEWIEEDYRIEDDDELEYRDEIEIDEDEDFSCEEFALSVGYTNNVAG